MDTSIDPSDQERVAALRALVRPNLSEYYDTDFNLLRWLQGHPGTLEDVADKLNLHLKARSSSWKLDTFLDHPRKHPIHDHWKYGITGPSGVIDSTIVNIDQTKLVFIMRQKGSMMPVVLYQEIKTGQVDFWGMLQTHSITEILKARIYDLEDMLSRVMTLEKKTGKQASIIYVMDLTGLKYNAKLYHLTTGPLRSLSDFMAVHYVELIKYFVIVNLPSFAYAMWTVVKPILPERTREKLNHNNTKVTRMDRHSQVRILNSSNWREEVLEYARADSLPDKWNTPDDIIFTSTLDVPTLFDQNDYCNNNFQVPENAIKLRVPAGKSVTVDREAQAGDRLSWWIVGDADMGFGVLFTENQDETDADKMEVVYPDFGWMPGPSVVPLEDSVVVDRKGVYKLKFTNDRAWLRSLNITLAVTVTQT